MPKYYLDSAESRAEDKAGILNCEDWPRWPLLPLKRSGPEINGLECGLLLAGERPFKVYRVILFHLKTGPLREQLDQAGVFGEYPTIEAMQDDGWRVD